MAGAGRGPMPWIGGAAFGLCLAAAAMLGTGAFLSELPAVALPMPVPPATMMPPRFGPARLGRLRALLARGQVDERLAREAAPIEPLAWEPLHVAALAALRTGDAGRGMALLRAALHREPRAIPVRLALLAQAARGGDPAAAFDQIAMLERLAPTIAGGLLTRLAASAATPAEADRLAVALRPHPSLYGPLLAGMAAGHPSAAIQARLSVRIGALPAADDATRTLAIAHLVGLHLYGPAFALWRIAHPAARDQLVRDPEFRDPGQTAPFGWRLDQDEGGEAARAADGIDVTASGRAAAVVAAQLLVLPPGAYGITIDHQGDRGGNDGGGAGLIALRLRCADTGMVLAEQRLDTAGRGRERLPATLPAGGCPAQWLEIVVQAGSVDGPQQVHVGRIAIDAVPSFRRPS